MLKRLAALAVAGLGLGLSLVVAAVPLASPVYANDDNNDPPSPSDPPAVTPTSEGGLVSVTVTGVGTTVEGGSFSTARTQGASPVCWYGRDMTGLEYYEYWKLGGVARESGTLNDFAYQGLLYPNYEAYATDTTGYWYAPDCQYDAPTDYVEQYRADHPPVYWTPGEVAPAVQQISARELAQIAYEFTDLPAGTIGWNPRAGGVGATVVNLDTWVWVAGAPTTVSVTASVPGTWARVDAVLDRVELSAPGADPVTCTDPGVPWSEGVTSTSCSIWFTRSSANQPVKDGQVLPTSTLTVTAVWTASWVSSDSATPTGLPSQEVTTTAEIPVAEIQALVTLGG